jgi:hypothetical protein
VEGAPRACLPDAVAGLPPSASGTLPPAATSKALHGSAASGAPAPGAVCPAGLDARSPEFRALGARPSDAAWGSRASASGGVVDGISWEAVPFEQRRPVAVANAAGMLVSEVPPRGGRFPSGAQVPLASLGRLEVREHGRQVRRCLDSAGERSGVRIALCRVGCHCPSNHGVELRGQRRSPFARARRHSLQMRGVDLGRGPAVGRVARKCGEQNDSE